VIRSTGAGFARDRTRVARALTALTGGVAITVSSLAAAGGVAATAESGATAQSTITRVSPMRAKISRTITIRGTGFSAIRKRNTVILKGAGGRLSLAKPISASGTKLVVRIPFAAERLLTRHPAGGAPTRVSLRVITSRYGKASIKRHSPVLVSAL